MGQKIGAMLEVDGVEGNGMGALDGVPEEGKRGTGVNNMALGKCLLLSHLCMFNCRKGIREVILRRGS